jgi:hypothetical protein
MTTIGHHLRQALKTWRSTPGLAITVVLTIALGIGVNATVLGLVEALVLRPLPAVSDAAHIVTTTRNPFSYPSYRVFAGRQRMFERMAVWQQLSLNLVADGRAERARGLVVSGSYFETLGVRASKGRVLMAADDELGDRIPAVLSASLWRARFDAREDIVGRQISLNRQLVTVVGIAPEGFAGTDLGYPAEVFVPITAHTPISLAGVIDLRVMAAAALLALTATAACGVAPAIHAGRTNLQPLLGRAAYVAARRRFGSREALIAIQVGASVALMVGAVLFLATLRNQEALSPGFQPEGVAFARLQVGLAGHSRASGEDVFRRLVERLESHPP